MGIRDWTCIVPNEPAGVKCLEDLFGNTVSLFISLAGLALFVMLIIGGYTYLISGDSPEQAAKARATMGWAVAGIVFMILSYIIMLAIGWFTGIEDLLDFTIIIFPAS